MNVRRTFATVAAAAVLAASLSACSGQAGTQPAQAPTSASQAVTEAPEVQAPAELPSNVLALGETATLDAPVESTITVSKPKSFRTSDSATTPSVTATKFTVTLKNTGTEMRNPSALTFTAATDGVEAESIYDMDSNVGGAPDTALRPGRTVSFDIAFEGDAKGTWDVDVTDTSGTVELYFSGKGAGAAQEPKAETKTASTAKEAPVSKSTVADEEAIPTDEELGSTEPSDEEVAKVMEEVTRDLEKAVEDMERDN